MIHDSGADVGMVPKSFVPSGCLRDEWVGVSGVCPGERQEC